MAGLSIIIPTYNRANLLRTALDSIQELRVPHGWQAEILVIDNNSPGETAQVVAEASERPLPARRVLEKNQGLNHARNRGVAEAAFEHLVFLDDDILVDNGWLEAYVEVQSAFAADCVVGPVEPWFEEPPPRWMTPAVIRSVSSPYSWKGSQSLLLPRARAHEVPGSNFGVLRGVALEVGGFHPELDRSGTSMLAGGDFEFGERLARLGKRVAYSPHCRVRHFISRQKISVEGLRSRWEGVGATTRALMLLRGQSLPATRRSRMFLRMIRFYLRSLWYGLRGDKGRSLEWELQAKKILGLLFPL